MAAIMQTMVLASLGVYSARCLTIPSSFEKTVLRLEVANQAQQTHSFGGAPIPSDSDRRYPVVSSTASTDDDELSAAEKTLALQATVYDNLAPLVQLASALPDKKPIEGLTKLKSGYSKVITSAVTEEQLNDSSDSSSTAADPSSTDNSPALVEDSPTETSPPSQEALGKSIEKSKDSVVVGGGPTSKYHAVMDEDEDDEDVYDVETIVPGRGELPQFSPNMSAKESLSTFMRQHFYAASPSESSTQGSSGGQAMAAKLTINDDAASSAATEEDPEAQAQRGEEGMRRLEEFVEKFMSEILKAKMHEVRVEHKENSLHDYRTM